MKERGTAHATPLGKRTRPNERKMKNRMEEQGRGKILTIQDDTIIEWIRVEH